MSNVVNRTTKQFIRSVNTPDYPVIDWIINPDMGAVVGFNNKYWIVTGDIVSLMDQAARDVVDAAELSDRRDETANRLDSSQDVMVEFFKLIIIELNRKTDKTNSILLAAENATSLADFQTRMNLITDEPNRTMAQLKIALRSALDN